MSPARAGRGRNYQGETRNTLKIIFCPRPARPPIDSVKTKLDVVGLFNHCVTVKLADGRIIEQNIYPGSTHCQEIFLQSWSMLLNSQWNQDVTIDCCTSELCNGPRDKTLAWSSAPRLLHLPPVLLLAIIILLSSL